MSIRIFYPLFLLLIPLFGNVYSDEVNWSLFDFLVMGTILLTMGILINLIIDKLKKRSFKVLLIIVTILVFALIYLELAVGIFGTPFAGS